jgi:hypothetical protein
MSAHPNNTAGQKKAWLKSRKLVSTFVSRFNLGLPPYELNPVKKALSRRDRHRLAVAKWGWHSKQTTGMRGSIL